MKMSVKPPTLRARPDERMQHFALGAIIGFLLGVLFVVVLL